MANASFFSRLFSRPAPVPPEVLAAQQGLKDLQARHPSLTEPARLLHALLTVCYDAPIPDLFLAMNKDQAADRLGSGTPLLRGVILPLEEVAFRERWQRVGRTLAEYQPEFSPLRAGIASPLELLHALLAGQADVVNQHADNLGCDPALLKTLLRLTAFPLLAKLNAGLAPIYRDIRWEQGFCLVCGSWPLLGEFRGLEQVRFLRCGLCAAEWQFPRLCCPFCGTRDHEKLGSLHVENEEAKYRAATCDHCQGYVKMATTFAPFDPPQLLVADVATLYLDLAAADRGYLPPVG